MFEANGMQAANLYEAAKVLTPGMVMDVKETQDEIAAILSDDGDTENRKWWDVLSFSKTHSHGYLYWTEYLVQ